MRLAARLTVWKIDIRSAGDEGGKKKEEEKKSEDKATEGVAPAEIDTGVTEVPEVPASEADPVEKPVEEATE